MVDFRVEASPQLADRQLDQAAHALTDAASESNHFFRYVAQYEYGHTVIFHRAEIGFRIAEGSAYIAFDGGDDVVGVLLCQRPGSAAHGPMPADALPFSEKQMQALQYVMPLRAATTAKAYKPGQQEAAFHLSILGVAPAYQRKGVGTALIQAALQDADTAGLEVTASTPVKENVPYFQRFGFEVPRGGHQLIPLPEGAEVPSFDDYAFLRPARSSPDHRN